MIVAHDKNKRRDQGNHALDALPGGRDLLAMFEAVCTASAANEGLLQRLDAQQYSFVTDQERIGDRALFIEMSIGYYGETRRSFDVKRKQITHEATVDEADLLTTRSLLLVPPRQRVAIMFNESAQLSSGGSRLLKHFHSTEWPRHYADDLTLIANSILEGDAWLEDADVKTIQAEVFNWSPDQAEEGTPQTVDLVQELHPVRGRRFFDRTVKALLADENKRDKLFGFRDGIEVDRISVEVEANGRTKTYEIDKAKPPPVRYRLSESGTKLSDDAFIKECLVEAQLSLFPRVGGSWQTAWHGSGKRAKPNP